LSTIAVENNPARSKNDRERRRSATRRHEMRLLETAGAGAVALGAQFLFLAVVLL
jgi:hypothetical protein